jgi:hypothetical protein
MNSDKFTLKKSIIDKNCPSAIDSEFNSPLPLEAGVAV